ncbi:hypothetical protein [Tissierella praeacuta]
MIYNLLKNLIDAGKYEKEDMTNKLDVFFAFDRINTEQYQELLEKVNQ